jgi:hypothetical protein
MGCKMYYHSIEFLNDKFDNINFWQTTWKRTVEFSACWE